MALKKVGQFGMQRDLAFFRSFRRESKIRFGGHTNRTKLEAYIAPEQVHHFLLAKAGQEKCREHSQFPWITGGKELRQFAEPAGTSAVRFAPEGKFVALGNNDGSVRLVNVADGKEKRQFKAHQGTIATIAFSADGKRLATRGSYDGLIRVFDAEKGTELKQITYHDIKAGNGARIKRQEKDSLPSGEQLPQREVVSRVVTCFTLQPNVSAMAAAIGARTRRASCFSHSVTRRPVNSG